MTTRNKLSVIYPVILSVPESDRRIELKKRTASLSWWARQALKISENRSGLKLGELLKDENGAPIPVNHVYWSLSHKPEYVAAVVSMEKIGIDIEKIRPCAAGLFQKAATKCEWALFGSHETASFIDFFRCWTAKEAVIKAERTGLKDLLRCTILKIVDAHHLIVGFQDRRWLIEHLFFRDHIASVVKNSETVEWALMDQK